VLVTYFLRSKDWAGVQHTRAFSVQHTRAFSVQHMRAFSVRHQGTHKLTKRNALPTLLSMINPPAVLYTVKCFKNVKSLQRAPIHCIAAYNVEHYIVNIFYGEDKPQLT